MRLLVDTHILVWILSGDRALPPRAAELLRGPDVEAYVSAIAIWEIAIKNARRRGRNDDIVISGKEALAFTRESRFQLLAVGPEHAAAVDDLPPHHNDPFDRMMVAQAMVEDMRLLTHDSRLAAYGDVVLPT